MFDDNSRILSTRASWVAIGAVLLGVDYFTLPFVQFPITFVFPVMLAAWHRRIRWAIGLAVVLPAGRLAFHFMWDNVPWSFEVSVLNFFIRLAVLAILAVVTWKLSMKYRELKTKVVRLERLLPICIECKMIRDENDDWQPLESYFTSRTRVVFNHRRCPHCQRAAIDAAHDAGDPQALSFCE